MRARGSARVRSTKVRKYESTKVRKYERKLRFSQAPARESSDARSDVNSALERLKSRQQGHTVRLRGLGGPAVCGVPCTSASATERVRPILCVAKRAAAAATVHEGGLCVFPAANSFALGADSAAWTCAASHASARPNRQASSGAVVTAGSARAAASAFEQAEVRFFGPATRDASGRFSVAGPQNDRRWAFLTISSRATVISKERRAVPADTPDPARD
jgi:hypothetical protein